MNENLKLAQSCLDSAQRSLSWAGEHLTAYGEACVSDNIARAQKYLEAYYEEQQK